MTEPTRELRALAATLFAAGRAERPAPALGRRLMLIDPRRDGSGALQPIPPEADEHPDGTRTRQLAARRWALWVAAAALLAGGVGAGVSLGSERTPIAISAERVAGSAAAAARQQGRALANEESSRALPGASPEGPFASQRLGFDDNVPAIGKPLITRHALAPPAAARRLHSRLQRRKPRRLAPRSALASRARSERRRKRSMRRRSRRGPRSHRNPQARLRR